MKGIDTQMDYTETEIGNKKVKRLRPLGDRVLVRVLPPEDEMVNGLVIPDTAKEKPQEGLVIEVGNGKFANGERISIDVQRGQKVVFGKYSGNVVKVNNEDLLLLQENELQAVYEED